MAPKSVKKKLKQPSFAAGVNRDEVREGAEELGVDFDEHVAFVIAAMAARAGRARPGARESQRLRRGWKILIARRDRARGPARDQHVVVDSETKDAEVTIDGGRDHQPPRRRRAGARGGRPAPGAPIVLLHCYSCSLHWWDELAPILASDHRVIRIDLLGHGGSQKPSSGYAIEDQAGLVAGALDRLGVQGAVVVGHSMGFSVAVALADRASQLVDRLVNIDEGPSEDSCSLPFLAKARLHAGDRRGDVAADADFAIEDGYADAFAPGFDLADGFPNPDQVVDDYQAMTYTSYKDVIRRGRRLRRRGDARPAPAPDPGAPALDLRHRGPDLRPRGRPGGLRRGAGRPARGDRGRRPLANVEKPEETARLIEELRGGRGAGRWAGRSGRMTKPRIAIGLVGALR